MAMSAEQIQALAEAVAAWRMQEYIYISFYFFYVYYVLTTTVEEVSIIFPQRWNRGKMLYATIRYGTILYIALQLTRDYQTYLSISPGACKGILITYMAIHWATYVACDFSLALCLSALLQSKAKYLAGIVILSCGNPLISGIFHLISYFQYDAEPVSLLDADLGYPCYVPDAEEMMKKTVLNLGRDVRSYVNLVAAAFLALLGIVSLVARYKGQGNQLLLVIRRDGGIHFLSSLAIRAVSATLWTPGVVPVAELSSNPVYLVFNMANYIIIPILAQRLLINMRKVNYMGSEPIASKLLFAPPAPGSEDDLEGDFGSLEMTQGRQEPSGQRQRGSAGEGSEMGEADVRDSGV